MFYLKEAVRYMALPFVCFVFAFKMLGIRMKAKKYRKDPSLVPQELRFKKIYQAACMFLYIRGIRIEVKKEVAVPTKKALFVCNHQSNCDGIILFKALYEAEVTMPVSFVVKAELKNWKISHAILDLIDCVYVDRSSIRSAYTAFQEQNKLVKDNNHSIFVFPEGKRNVDKEGFYEFKEGTLEVAYTNHLPVVPLVIYGSKGFFDKNVKLKIENKRKKVYVEFLKSVQPKDYINIKSSFFANNLSEEMIKEYNKIMELHRKGISIQTKKER